MKKKNAVTTKVPHKTTFSGVVVGAKVPGTVKVSIETTVEHPKYKKSLKKLKTYLVHTDAELKEGDQVVVAQSRPYSKNVKWAVKAIK